MDVRPYNTNKAQERNNKNWHCIKQIIKKDYIRRTFDCQVPNNGGLAFHYHERLYILGTDVDRRRRWMDRGGEEENGHKKKVSPI